MLAPDPAVHFDRVRKTFGDRPAVDGLSLSVPQGSIYGLLGPNGAGKTTSIRMLMGILRPDEGEIRVLGQTPGGSLTARTGYLPEERGLYRSMRVLDNLVYFGGLKGLSATAARESGQRWLERLGIAASSSLRLQELSRGNQQKVQFISAVIHNPELIALDEPFSGLDPVNQDLLREILTELAGDGVTILLSTHLMDEVERMCTHLSLLDSGSMLIEGELSEVKQRYGTDSIRMEFTGDASFVPDLDSVRTATLSGSALEIEPAPGASASGILAEIAPRLAVTRFEMRRPSLHRIFVRLVSGQRAPERDEPEVSPLPAAGRADR
ncbi:MAG: ATP-binding cassette domain-containing protein [Gemmatimonadota bacterium]|nr:ABC transporter [Gemmatimonadota bacterium]MDP6529687.1 ATP-binding cassette domain-containing protein [Gemmatimonadota bacterium]MDP6802474.1 ATP-binding cassette domain-containing protein [Gemmatimonadota bacterium]